MRTLYHLLFFAALAIPLAGFGQVRQTLGPGDVVRLTVFQNPDLTTEARISERGTIGFPLIGEVTIGGLDPADAEVLIARKLVEGEFVLKPQVSLNVLRVRSRQVSVLGQVMRPGNYPLDDTSAKLTDILALAGGIGPAGDDNVTVMIHRDGKAIKQDIDVSRMYRTGDLSANVELQNGDEVYVPRAPVFYIHGEVQRAGTYRLEPDMTVEQALSVGGGMTRRGTQRGLKIHRRTPDGQVLKIEADLTDQVRAEDVIYVKASLF